jgi:transcription initiation factor TFIID subunit 2
MLLLVEALAQQWMGVWLQPKAPSDDWLLSGLCSHLVNVFIGRYLGRNELLFRQGLQLNKQSSRLP